ncbi:MAG: dienelactone hydrolase, partial [Candidatus Aegiribacteria sp.]|nr:dienelactone hydrolase [Candidatus Aegiribacteria sp.]
MLPVLIMILIALVPPVEEPAYDPLVSSFDVAPQILDLTVTDERRQRDIPVRVYVPPDGMNCSVVLFSHGLGGSREPCGYLGQ